MFTEIYRERWADKGVLVLAVCLETNLQIREGREMDRYGLRLKMKWGSVKIGNTDFDSL